MQNRFPNVVDDVREAADKRKKGPGPWVGLIIHHTDIGGRDPAQVTPDLWRRLYEGITSWLTKADENYVSAHFHIGRDGRCAQLVDPDSHVAYHAGQSAYYHPLERKWVSGWNDYAIGIELLGDGNRGPYSDEQYAKLAELCRVLMQRYPSIDPRCVTGHECISPGRKVDPGRHFNWNRFFTLLYK